MSSGDKKIKNFITGAAGFIGANLVRALAARGEEVFATVRPGSDNWRLRDLPSSITLLPVDLSDPDRIRSLIKELQPERVFHLAHYGGNKNENDPALVRRIIIEGTAAIYEACQETGSCRAIINFGSSSEYGSKKEPMKETMMVEPNTPYGVAKVWATLYGQHLARERGVPIVTIRPFSVYGPFEAKNRLISAAILNHLNHQPMELTNPKTARDFIYIDDLIEAVLLMADNVQPGEVFNVGSEKQTTVEELVNQVAAITGEETALKWGSFPSQSFDTNFWQADVSHIKEKLGWQPKTDLRSGLEKDISWFKDNKHLYDEK